MQFLLQEHAICRRLEVAGNVISDEDVKTIKAYTELNFEVASFGSFRDIKLEGLSIGEATRRHSSHSDCRM